MARGQLRVRIVGDSRNLERVLGRTSARLTRWARRGAFALAGTLVAGVGASIRAFANFDQAMTRSTAIMGDLSSTMRDDMARAAREVAKTTQFSATEAAEAYFFLASAGLDAKQSIEALPQVAAFAQAGQFDMARATDLATDAQSALAMSSEDAEENLRQLTRVTDVFVKANTLANASVEEFATAITSKGGAALRAVNKDIEEGVAVLSVFADQGVKGSEAGTILARTLDGLVERARVSSDQFETLGIRVFDSEGEMRNMADIVADMERAFDGMTTEQRNTEMAQLGFNERTRRGIEMLLGSSDAIREYEGLLRDAAGTTQEVADNQMQTFWAQLGLVKDQLVDIGLSIGEALMPALMGFVDWLQDHLPAITGWFERVGERFTDLLGTSEESMDGSIEVVDSFTAAAQRMSEDTTRALSDLSEPLDSFENQARQRLEAAGEDVGVFVSDVEQGMDEAGVAFERLWEAWKVIWEEEVQPWLLNDVPEWITETFIPRLVDTLMDAGSAAAAAFWQGFRDRLMGRDEEFSEELSESIARFSDRARDAASRAWGAVSDRLFQEPDQQFDPRTGLPTSNGTGGTTNGGIDWMDLRRRGFDQGGVIPGPRGADRIVAAHAGETILPTHKHGALAPFHVHVNLGGRELVGLLIDPLSREVAIKNRLTAGAGL